EHLVAEPHVQAAAGRGRARARYRVVDDLNPIEGELGVDAADAAPALLAGAAAARDHVAADVGVGQADDGVLGGEGAARAGALMGGHAVVERDHFLRGGLAGDLPSHPPAKGGPTQGGHRHVVVERDVGAADVGGGVDVQGGAAGVAAGGAARAALGAVRVESNVIQDQTLDIVQFQGAPHGGPPAAPERVGTAPPVAPEGPGLQ